MFNAIDIFLIAMKNGYCLKGCCKNGMYTTFVRSKVRFGDVKCSRFIACGPLWPHVFVLRSLAAHKTEYANYSLVFFVYLMGKKAVDWLFRSVGRLLRSSICLHCFTSTSPQSSDSDSDANINRLWTVIRKKYICMLYVLIRIRFFF